MKKSLVSALTTALVVGAASTTFAAANPFSDVPADHWAYDAVAQLAAEGVVEGYGDGSYRGQQEITRYEMAQMVAKAMAKGVNSAVLDKLAAEFADELNQLGVRVAALEKKVDNVKFTGELRYRAHRKSPAEYRAGESNKNELLLRLNMKAQVNKNWTVNSRFDYSGSAKTSADIGSVKVDRLWAEGQYGKTTIKLGKFNHFTAADYGLVNDRRVTGIQVTTGKKIKVGVTAGRYLLDKVLTYDDKDTANYWGIEVYNDRAQKFTYGIGYHSLRSADFGLVLNRKNISIWSIGAGYKFNKNVALEGAFARANVKGQEGLAFDGRDKKRYAITLKYKGANRDKRGSYGLFVGYRHVGELSGMYNTYSNNNTVLGNANFKGFEFGADYTLDKNILLGVRYFMGKAVNKVIDETKQRGVMAQVEWFF